MLFFFKYSMCLFLLHPTQNQIKLNQQLLVHKKYIHLLLFYQIFPLFLEVISLHQDLMLIKDVILIQNLQKYSLFRRMINHLHIVYNIYLIIFYFNFMMDQISQVQITFTYHKFLFMRYYFNVKEELLFFKQYNPKIQIFINYFMETMITREDIKCIIK